MLKALSGIVGHGLLCCLLLVGCSHNASRVGVSERSSGQLNGRGYHIVDSGDTLSEIATRYGMDYRVLARYNGIRSPYVIRQGQKLWLHDRNAGRRSSTTARARIPARTGSTKSARSGKAATGGGSWVWPTKGQVVVGYSASGKVNKGINIGGELGQSVNAARAGEVVYAGEGLKSYGLLVIIKHDEQYISAYAYNRRAYVREGDNVKKGQKIAQMGAKQGERAQLHFEIRRDGRPVDPIRFLPAK